MSSIGGGGKTLAVVSVPSKHLYPGLTWIQKLSVPELLSRSDQAQTDLPPILADGYHGWPLVLKTPVDPLIFNSPPNSVHTFCKTTP